MQHVSHLEGITMPDSRSDAHTFAASIGQKSLSRRHMLVASGGVGLGALAFAACSSSSSPQGAGSGGGGVPKKGGTIRLAISDGQASDSLDPGLIISQNTAIVCNALYDSLTRVDDDFTPKPALAQS